MVYLLNLRGYSNQVDQDEIIRVLRAFEEAGLEYVLIGATAMGFHGLVRATQDLDLFIEQRRRTLSGSASHYEKHMIASFETVDSEIKEVEGTKVTVATPQALYRLKKGTIRVQDHLDAAALREQFNLQDEN